jgi:hypothetical protein
MDYRTIDIEIDIFYPNHRIINRIVEFSLSHRLRRERERGERKRGRERVGKRDNERDKRGERERGERERERG